MKEIARVGIIGLGRRGTWVLRDFLRKMPDVEIAAVSDLEEARMEGAAELLAEVGKARPKFYSDYHELVKDPLLDAVFVLGSWSIHVDAALASLRAGKYTAIEVGVAYDLSECYALMDAHEQTGAPLMMLENSCYGVRELTGLRLAKEGYFGELVHASGGYHHYLPSCDLFRVLPDGSVDTNHYRLTEYKHRNAEQYPTHELGPIAKTLGLGHGNRMVRLSSVASKSAALADYMERHVPGDHPFRGSRFLQGDIVSTIISCANGETIALTLDTTLPMPDYSRGMSVRGTRGGYMELGKMHGSFWIEGLTERDEREENEFRNEPGRVFDNERLFFRKYPHPLIAEMERHGGAGNSDDYDWICFRAFIESVKAGTDTPINAYDTVSWMAIGPLSEMSIRNGGAPVSIPDFSRGKWIRSEPFHGKYSLDEVRDYPEIPMFPGDSY